MKKIALVLAVALSSAASFAQINKANSNSSRISYRSPPRKLPPMLKLYVLQTLKTRRPGKASLSQATA